MTPARSAIPRVHLEAEDIGQCSGDARLCWWFWTAGAGARTPADNAIRQAKTPTFDRLWQTGPHGFLRTSGKDVGLPTGRWAIPKSAISISAPAAW